ncbi:terminase small subunit [Adhaeribacter radiodurans]|uniref:Uncharacterized protein n=1 Tax=Adhaeribacter radiodurans TaxID=2745197 RepID=A0A7L7LBD9_9BACT|nr:terminase small subunit [Adhaeribacter radiodurans]QMU30140.1 hypothetical protein HUW48_19840 [Adhaeribacter radiodurans]
MIQGNNCKRRTKHGRPRRFITPEALWQAASAYFEWCDINPLTKPELNRWYGKQDCISLIRPYTLRGFCQFNKIGVNYLKQLKASLAPHEQELYFTIIRIEKIIWVQQFEGACVGAFNPLIIARSLALNNKTQQVNLFF